MGLEADPNAYASGYREKDETKFHRPSMKVSHIASRKVKGPKAAEKKFPIENINLQPLELKDKFPGFILFQDYNSFSATSILFQSAAKNKRWKNIRFHYFTVATQSSEMKCCKVTLNGIVMSSAVGSTKRQAKAKAALLALETLRMDYYTIWAKCASDKKLVVSKDSLQTDAPESIALPHHIGASTMLKMESKESGLGKDHKRIKIPFRVDLSHPNMRIFIEKFKKILEDFVFNNPSSQLMLASDFSDEERNIARRLAEKYNLKTQFHGKNEKRHLVIYKAKELPDILQTLLICGGENKNYKLIHPLRSNKSLKPFQVQSEIWKENLSDDHALGIKKSELTVESTTEISLSTPISSAKEYDTGVIRNRNIDNISKETVVPIKESPIENVKTNEERVRSTSFLHSNFVDTKPVNLPTSQMKGEFPGFIIFQSSKNPPPLTTLQQSARRNAKWKCLKFSFSRAVSESSNMMCCNVSLNGKTVSSAVGSSKKITKTKAVLLALENLRRNYVTIQEKLVNDEIPVSKDSLVIDARESNPLPLDNGLGKDQLGIEISIEASQIMNKEGMGNRSMSIFRDNIKKVLEDFISFNPSDELTFSSNFSSEERKVIHFVAEDMNLKSKSTGKNGKRHVTVRKEKQLQDILQTLVMCGGENKYYKLIPPQSNTSGPPKPGLESAVWKEDMSEDYDLGTLKSELHVESKAETSISTPISSANKFNSAVFKNRQIYNIPQGIATRVKERHERQRAKIKTKEERADSTPFHHSSFFGAQSVKLPSFPGFILFQDYNNFNPLSILLQSVHKNEKWKNLQIRLSVVNELSKMQYCEITLNGKKISSAFDTTKKQAKAKAAFLALENLRRDYFTIQAKCVGDKSPIVSKDSFQADAFERNPLPLDNIGAHIMLKMGWKGSGLGKNQQGIEAPIKTPQTANRAGLGYPSMRSFIDNINKILEDFVSSNSSIELNFAPNFSTEERKIIRRLAQDMNLKTSNQIKYMGQHFSVYKVRELPDILETLVMCGGEDDNYKLIHPLRFDSNVSEFPKLFNIQNTILEDDLLDQDLGTTKYELLEEPQVISSASTQDSANESDAAALKCRLIGNISNDPPNSAVTSVREHTQGSNANLEASDSTADICESFPQSSVLDEANYVRLSDVSTNSIDMDKKKEEKKQKEKLKRKRRRDRQRNKNKIIQVVTENSNSVSRDFSQNKKILKMHLGTAEGNRRLKQSTGIKRKTVDTMIEMSKAKLAKESFTNVIIPGTTIDSGKSKDIFCKSVKKGISRDVTILSNAYLETAVSIADIRESNLQSSVLEEVSYDSVLDSSTIGIDMGKKKEEKKHKEKLRRKRRRDRQKNEKKIKQLLTKNSSSVNRECFQNKKTLHIHLETTECNGRLRQSTSQSVFISAGLKRKIVGTVIEMPKTKLAKNSFKNFAIPGTSIDIDKAKDLIFCKAAKEGISRGVTILLKDLVLACLSDRIPGRSPYNSFFVNPVVNAIKTVPLRRQVENTIINLAVVPERFPICQLSEENADLIASAMSCAFQPLQNGILPQFLTNYFERGAYILSCLNKETADWVREIIPTLQPWKEAKLIVGSQLELKTKT